MSLVDGEVLRAFMEYWDRLARDDRDALKEHFPDDKRQIGYYDGYAEAARDAIHFLDKGRFAVGAEKPDISSTSGGGATSDG